MSPALDTHLLERCVDAREGDWRTESRTGWTRTTEAERAEILRLKAEDWTHDDIAARTGRSSGTVSNVVRGEA